jgi:hypothetical protein
MLVNEDLQSPTHNVTTPSKKQSIWFELTLPKNKKTPLKKFIQRYYNRLNFLISICSQSHQNRLFIYLFIYFWDVTSKLCSSNLIVENLPFINFIKNYKFFSTSNIFFSKIRKLHKIIKNIIYAERIHVFMIYINFVKCHA